MLNEHSPLEILIFFLLVFFFLWLDLSKHKKNEEVSIKSAATWTLLWVSLALIFMGYLGLNFGSEPAQLFLAGYLLEASLSIDNLFVIMAIFASFGIKDAYQHRVLYYGILGALIMRFFFIVAGTKLVTIFGDYVLGIFGFFILWTAFKMWQAQKQETKEVEDFTKHFAVRVMQKFIPIHPKLEGEKFFVKKTSENNKTLLMATPLFLCLLVIEISDVMFAFDSVPAIIAITSDPVLVYTSNIFAILGLRSMYFLLAAAKRYLRYLEKSVIAILSFIGIKMLFAIFLNIHISSMLGLSIVAGLLLLGIGASFLPVAPNK